MSWELDFSRVFKALAHPSRVKLFLEICRDGAAIEASEANGCLLHGIIERMGLGAPTASHHLKELVQAGLVQTERDGKFLRCRVNQDTVARMAGFFSGDAVSHESRGESVPPSSSPLQPDQNEPVSTTT